MEAADCDCGSGTGASCTSQYILMHTLHTNGAHIIGGDSCYVVTQCRISLCSSGGFGNLNLRWRQAHAWMGNVLTFSGLI